MQPFEYYAPGTVAEAVRLLRGGNAKALLGGTDLLVQMEENLIQPEALVDLTEIPELHELSAAGEIVIGAAVTHARLVQWTRDKTPYLALAEASKSVGTPQVRNIATVAGNLCNAVPSADLGAPVLVFQGVLTILGPEGEKCVPAQSFFTGPKRTVLKQGEIVTRVLLEAQPPRTASRYIKLGPRRASDLATVGVAALLTLNEAGIIMRLRVGLGAVAPTPLLIDGLEQFIGRRFGPDIAVECGKLAVQACRPITDIRASADYRREMAGILTQRAVEDCAARIEGGCGKCQ